MPGISYQIFKKLHVELTLPNLIAMSYSVNKSFNSNTPESYSKKENFAVNTAFTNAAILNTLGIGFRFVL
jgi:hypothetical protein